MARHPVRAHADLWEARDVGRELLGHMLDLARDHRDRVERFKLAGAGLDPDRWLCIIGVGSETRVGLKIKKSGGYPEFDLGSDYRRNRWKKFKDPKERVETGDGTVPYLGGKPTFLGVENLICLQPKDFGSWEVADRTLVATAGFHAMLPQMNLVHRLIVSHFTGRRGKGTWGRVAPDIGDRKWDPPINGLKKKG